MIALLAVLLGQLLALGAGSEVVAEGAVAGRRQATGSLTQYNVTDVTVSGISSGGYMAVQVHVAFSEIVNGAASFAGGPYYCAEGSILTAEYSCMKTSLGAPDTSKLVRITNEAAAVGNIDAVENMANDRIYLFSGQDDTVVETEVVDALMQYYKVFVDASNIVADYAGKSVTYTYIHVHSHLRFFAILHQTPLLTSFLLLSSSCF
jgi:hypothetical protein